MQAQIVILAVGGKRGPLGPTRLEIRVLCRYKKRSTVKNPNQPNIIYVKPSFLCHFQSSGGTANNSVLRSKNKRTIMIDVDN